MKYTPIHFDLDYLKGIVLTDGHVSLNNGVRITTSDEDYATLFSERGYSVRSYKHSGSFSKRPHFYIRIGNLTFSETSLKLQVDKRFDDLCIVDSGKFLAGVIDGNGYVSASRAEVEISLPNNRPELLDIVLIGLGNIEVVGKVYTSGKKNASRVQIKNIMEVSKLAAVVSPHLLLEKKRKRLERYLK